MDLRFPGACTFPGPDATTHSLTQPTLDPLHSFDRGYNSNQRERTPQTPKAQIPVLWHDAQTRPSPGQVTEHGGTVQHAALSSPFPSIHRSPSRTAQSSFAARPSCYAFACAATHRNQRHYQRIHTCLLHCPTPVPNLFPFSRPPGQPRRHHHHGNASSHDPHTPRSGSRPPDGCCRYALHSALPRESLPRVCPLLSPSPLPRRLDRR